MLFLCLSPGKVVSMKKHRVTVKTVEKWITDSNREMSMSAW